MFRYLVLLAAFLSTLALQAAESRPLMVGVTTWMGVSPAYIAQSRNYWKQQGLDVKLVNYEDYDDLFKDFKAKKIDLVYDMLGTFVDMQQQGQGVVILAETDWSHGGDKIIAKDKLTDFRKLKGRPVGVYLDKLSITFFLDKFLKTKGLRYSDVKVVGMEDTDLTPAFIQNKFELIVNDDPPAIEAVRKGQGREVATSADFPGSIPEGFAALSDYRSRVTEEQLVSFFAGWHKAARWMKSEAKWSEVEQTLRQTLFADNKNMSGLDLLSMYNSVKIHSGKDVLARNQQGGTEAYLAEVGDFLLGNKIQKRDIDPAKLLDTDAFIKGYKKSLLPSK